MSKSSLMWFLAGANGASAGIAMAPVDKCGLVAAQMWAMNAWLALIAFLGFMIFHWWKGPSTSSRN